MAKAGLHQKAKEAPGIIMQAERDQMEAENANEALLRLLGHQEIYVSYPGDPQRVIPIGSLFYYTNPYNTFKTALDNNNALTLYYPVNSDDLRHYQETPTEGITVSSRVTHKTNRINESKLSLFEVHFDFNHDAALQAFLTREYQKEARRRMKEIIKSARKEFDGLNKNVIEVDPGFSPDMVGRELVREFIEGITPVFSPGKSLG